MSRYPSLIILSAVVVLAPGCSLFHASATGKYQEAVAAGPYDALIVPGFPSKDGRWNWVIKARVYWSRDLLEKGVARHSIYSGAAVHTPHLRQVAREFDLVDDRGLLWAEGFGHAGGDARTAATPETVFKVLSITKVFTAMAVLRAEQEGLVRLDEPITTCLPDRVRVAPAQAVGRTAPPHCRQRHSFANGPPFSGGVLRIA